MQSVFNTLSSKSAGSSAMSASAKADAFFSSENDAYNQYSKDFKEAQSKGLKIDVEGHYGIAGGEFGMALNSSSELSRSEFGAQFQRANSKRSTSSESAQASSEEFSTQVLNQVRDPETVKAWRECISRTPETNVYAFATRDGSGRVYVTVVWVPGPLAGTAPAISVEFVTDRVRGGIKVHAKQTELIAMGTGASFAVSCGKQCEQGFRLTVNAALRNANGSAVTSFTNAVEVPPMVDPRASDSKCAKFGGTWRRPSDNVVIEVAQSGCMFTGYVAGESGGNSQTIQGTASESRASGSLRRSVNGCTTTLAIDWILKNPSHFIGTALGDGCGLNGYREDLEYTRIGD